MKKISVIIPCYNVEQYIDECLMSIVTQSCELDMLEVICIDDASADCTLNKLRSWEEQYPNVIKVHANKTNMRQGSVRNLGMQNAMGEYIAFIDADDWVELNLFEYVLQVIGQKNYDVVMYRYDHPIDREKATNGICGQNMIYDVITDAQRLDFFKTYRLETAVWDKVYRKEFLKDYNIYFPEQLQYEDNFFAALTYLNLKNMYLINEVMYHWRQNPQSTTSTISHVTDRVPVQKLLQERLYRYKDEALQELLEYNTYEKAFAETLLQASRKNDFDAELVNQIKSDTLKLVPHIRENAYYRKLKETSYVQGEGLAHQLLEHTVNDERVQLYLNQLDFIERNTDIQGYVEWALMIKGMLVCYAHTAEMQLLLEECYKSWSDLLVEYSTKVSVRLKIEVWKEKWTSECSEMVVQNNVELIDSFLEQCFGELYNMEIS